MSTHVPDSSLTPAGPPEADSGYRWGRVLRWAAAVVLLAAGVYLSAFFVGWTFHPEASPSPSDIAAGLGFAVAIKEIPPAARWSTGRTLVGQDDAARTVRGLV